MMYNDESIDPFDGEVDDQFMNNDFTELDRITGRVHTPFFTPSHAPSFQPPPQPVAQVQRAPTRPMPHQIGSAPPNTTINSFTPLSNEMNTTSPLVSFGLPNEIFRNLTNLSSSQPNPVPSNPYMSNIFNTPQFLVSNRESNGFEEPLKSDSYGSELGDPRIGSHESDDLWAEDPALSPLRSPSDYSISTGHQDQNNPHEHPLGEHPSRTLFVRNINSNVEDEELKKLFEVFGPIRNMYTQCKHRGFVMISYYDIRNAKNAMRQLQSKVLRRRRLDIHYSIPKENPPEKDQNQGTLVVFNLDSSTTNEELKDIFGAYGEIKEIRETPNKKYHKFIEFYDVRDADKAMKNLNKTDLHGKKIKIEISRPGGRPKAPGVASVPGMLSSPPSSAPGALTRPPSDLSQEDEEDFSQSLPGQMYHNSDITFSPNSNSFGSSQTPPIFPSHSTTGFQLSPKFTSAISPPNSDLTGSMGKHSNPFASSPPSNHQIVQPTIRNPNHSLFTVPNEFASMFNNFPNSTLPNLGPSMGSSSTSSTIVSPIGVPMTRALSPPAQIHKHRASDEDKIRFALNISKVRGGQDIRTTLMIKNIPNKYSQKMLLTSIDIKNRGLYDFFYLPIDFKNKCNVGYAFINFIQPVHIIGFYEEFNNKKWEKFNSDKVCEIAYARIQGKISLVSHFQNSSLMSEDKKCRPMIFHSEGPYIGEQENFPIGPKVKQRVRDDIATP